MATLPSTADVSQVIGSIYDCALNPDLWDSTLSDLMALFRCCNAQLAVLDVASAQGRLLKTSGVEQRWLDLQMNYAAELVEWERIAFAEFEMAIDEPQVRSRHLPPAVLARSRYDAEWCRPQGIIDAIAMVIMNTPTQHAQIGMGRHRDFGLITDREVQLARILGPHIRRAITISNLLDLRSLESKTAYEALDGLRSAVVFVTADGLILRANAQAELMLRSQKPIRSIGGRIDANLPDAKRELSRALEIAGRDESEIGSAGLAVRLTPRGVPPVLAHVLPIKGGDARSRLLPKAAAAIFVVPVTHAANGAEAMAVAYDLTTMETRVLDGLLSGRSLAETAAALGVGRRTVKTHLGSIFAKTGASRQADVIRIASELVSPVGVA